MKNIYSLLILVSFASFTAACSSSPAEESGASLIQSSSSSKTSIATPLPPVSNVDAGLPAPSFAPLSGNSAAASTDLPIAGDHADVAAQSGEANAEADEETERDIEELELALDYQIKQAQIAQRDAHSQRISEMMGNDDGDMQKQMMELVTGIMMMNGMTNIVKQSTNPDPCESSAIGIGADETEAIINAVFLGAAMDAAKQ